MRRITIVLLTAGMLALAGCTGTPPAATPPEPTTTITPTPSTTPATLDDAIQAASLAAGSYEDALLALGKLHTAVVASSCWGAASANQQEMLDRYLDADTRILMDKSGPIAGTDWFSLHYVSLVKNVCG